jgi:hypothetical protein
MFIGFGACPIWPTLQGLTVPLGPWSSKPTSGPSSLPSAPGDRVGQAEVEGLQGLERSEYQVCDLQCPTRPAAVASDKLPHLEVCPPAHRDSDLACMHPMGLWHSEDLRK